MAGDERARYETLHLWHCPRCGYTNAAYDPCHGCHKPAPRRVKTNTKSHPQPEPQTALGAELLNDEPAEP